LCWLISTVHMAASHWSKVPIPGCFCGFPVNFMSYK
jgi:hypothetical protein